MLITIKKKKKTCEFRKFEEESKNYLKAFFPEIIFFFHPVNMEAKLWNQTDSTSNPLYHFLLNKTLSPSACEFDLWFTLYFCFPGDVIGIKCSVSR